LLCPDFRRTPLVGNANRRPGLGKVVGALYGGVGDRVDCVHAPSAFESAVESAVFPLKSTINQPRRIQRWRWRMNLAGRSCRSARRRGPRSRPKTWPFPVGSRSKDSPPAPGSNHNASHRPVAYKKQASCLNRSPIQSSVSVAWAKSLETWR